MISGVAMRESVVGRDHAFAVVSLLELLVAQRAAAACLSKRGSVCEGGLAAGFDVEETAFCHVHCGMLHDGVFRGVLDQHCGGAYVVRGVQRERRSA